MKKSFYALFSLLLFGLFYGQNVRFIYEFNYKKNPKATKMEQDVAILDIKDGIVQFYEQKALYADSINTKYNRMLYGYTYPFPKLVRKISSSENANYYLIQRDYFSFKTQNDTPKWKLSSETKTTKWKLQKATTTFGGRNWVAWFTTDIPISEGPYKFNGLPGLVVELKESNGNFHYNLIEINKKEKIKTNLVHHLFKKKVIPITLKQYQNLLLSNYEDPLRTSKTLQPGSVRNSEGKSLETAEDFRQQTLIERAYIKANNNPIELDKGVIYK